jgi:hypothetical protein
VRGKENLLATTWHYRRFEDPSVLDIAENVVNATMDWATLYNTMRWGGNDLTQPQGWRMDSHVVNHGMALKFGSIYHVYPNATTQDSLAAFNAVTNMRNHHHALGGTFTGDESIAGTEAWHGTEFCTVVEQMYSYEQMIEVFGEIEWADNLEKLAYNRLPAHMTPDGWNRQYHGQVNQVLVSSNQRWWMSSGNDANLYGNFDCLYGCCTSNLHQGWPKFVPHMWMATHDNGLAAVVYGPNTITAKVGAAGQDVTITQETEYPFKNTVSFTVTTAAAVAFPLVLRVPNWGQGTLISAPGASISAPAGGDASTGLAAGQWITLSKTWNNNDVVTVTLPFDVQVETINSEQGSNNNDIAVRRGPLYYALRVPGNWSKYRSYTNAMGACDWEITSADGKWNYALMIDPEDPRTGFEVVEQDIATPYTWGQLDEMVWNASTGAHEPLGTDVPVFLKARAKLVPQWGMANNSADTPPNSPITGLTAAEETVDLVPFGSSRLRIAVFPYYEGEGFVPKGCMDPNYAEYDPAVQVHDPAACMTLGTPIKEAMNALDLYIDPIQRRISIESAGVYAVSIYNIQGEQLYATRGSGSRVHSFGQLKGPGLYIVKVRGKTKTISKPFYLMQDAGRQVVTGN